MFLWTVNKFSCLWCFLWIGVVASDLRLCRRQKVFLLVKLLYRLLLVINNAFWRSTKENTSTNVWIFQDLVSCVSFRCASWIIIDFSIRYFLFRLILGKVGLPIFQTFVKERLKGWPIKFWHVWSFFVRLQQWRDYKINHNIEDIFKNKVLDVRAPNKNK